MRLIDVDALLNALQKLFDIRKKEQRFAEGKGANVTWNDAIYFIKIAPTVDAVPVIRCKDCKHSLQNQFTGDWYCWLYNIAREIESDGFCYKAERISSGQQCVTDLIRCKDCKHRDPEDKKCECGHDIIWQLPRDDNWFCADAEKKEE